MRALIDGDLPCYALAFVLQKGGEVEENIDVVYNLVDQYLQNIFRATEATCFTVYLSGKQNFRDKIYSEYKANRKGKEKPVHYSTIRDYLINHWRAKIVEEYEADDLVSIAQCKDLYEEECMKSPEESQTVIVSLDKDLNTVPGWHYNTNSGEKYWVTELEAMRNFYKMMITGDTVDNIPGLSKKAPERRTYKTEPLDDMDNEPDMAHYVRQGYIKEFGMGKWISNFDLNWKLLWILREPIDENI